MATVDYSFYTTTYKGNSLTQTDFERLEIRAEAKLEQWKRNYTVKEIVENGFKLALCAMVDALYYFESAANGLVVKSSSIGSVSSSMAGDVDCSPKGQEKELLSDAQLYLDIYRGVCKC